MRIELEKKISEIVSNRFANHDTIISTLRDKKILYEPKYRCDGVQGCFVGVRWEIIFQKIRFNN